MKGNVLSRRIRAALLAAAVFAAAIPFKADVKVYAEEADSEVAAEGESPVDDEIPADGELTEDLFEGEMSDMAQGTGVTPGTILANNGLYIANTFPDSMMPAGFHRQTVAYQGQNIDLAYMDNSDAVVLAYLTDVTGTVGDFYLCDTATATMSDYVKLDGGNGAFLIILDPGDNINPPAGFKKAVLNIDNKSVTAWTLPDGTEEEEDKKDKKKEGSIKFTETVYAGDLGLGIGAGSSDAGTGEAAASDLAGPADTATVVDNSYVDGTTVDDTSYDDAAAAEVAAANVQVDAAGFVKAQPSEFFLIYGIDYNGAQGFFLYDTLGHTYQRYLELETGESETTAKYKKSAQIRLFIIAGLILFSVVLIFIIVNMSLNGRRGGGRNLDDDDDVEEMKKRVRKKEVSSIRKNSGRRYAPDDDYEEDEDFEGGNNNYGGQDNGYGYNNVSMQNDYAAQEEDIRYYDRGDSRTGRGVQRNAARPADRMNQARPGVRTEMRSNVRTEARPQPQVRTEARPGVRTERRPYPPQGDQGYPDQGMQSDGGYGGNQGYGEQGYNSGSYAPDGRQDIDLDDDFNFDFIKPGK